MFLTGKYNFRNYSNWGYMSDTEKTVANLMHNAGYVTAIFGKLQLPYKYTTMEKWGWDRHLVFELTEDTMKYRRYKSPVLMDNGYRIPDSVTAGKYCDDILTQRILDFIDSNTARPFFVYYSMSIGHDPFSPTPDDAAFATWNPNNGVSNPIYFPSMVKYMDKKIGLIMDKLRATGLEGNTLVIYAGDNGTPVPITFKANGVIQQGEKGKTTEGGTHVPLIAYWPGHIAEGGVNDGLVDFTDFLPTFAEAAKVSDLSAYGTLDGVSIFQRLNGHNKIKPQLFFHYDPHPGGYDTLRRWSRNKSYKLYDSGSGIKSGKFYNVVTDVYETSPLADSGLTAKQSSIKATLQHILDTVGTWPNCPVLVNQFVSNVTSSSAVIGATVVTKGASALIDRGSNITTAKEGPYLNNNRQHAGTVALGTFSQKRSGLLPQTQYKFDLYAMNKNLSHSTGFIYGQFYTLAAPPTKQSVSFTAVVTDSGTTLAWTDAMFPKKGASEGGYVILYSTKPVMSAHTEKGKVPTATFSNQQVIVLPSSLLPTLPSKGVTLRNLSADSTYYFVLVPYTWNGVTDSTYNYLSENALALIINSRADVGDCISFAINTSPTFNQHAGGNIHLFPNPVEDMLFLNGLTSTPKTILIIDEAGKLLQQTRTTDDRCSFNTKQLAKGTYLVRVDQQDKVTVLRFIKQ
jgi:arylsulfatase A